MTPELHDKILDILARHDSMALATLRSDGYPQTTTVDYVNDGFAIYFGCGAQSQKAQNLARDPRMSAAIDRDHESWSEIEGLSLAGTAVRVTDAAKLAAIQKRFIAKFPQVAGFTAEDRAGTSVFRVTPSIISVLDYSKGFGHSDLVAV